MHVLRGLQGEERLVSDMIEQASLFGRFGYCQISALIGDRGWSVSDGRVERLWGREGLKVPAKQPEKARLWQNAVSGVRSPTSREYPKLCVWVSAHAF